MSETLLIGENTRVPLKLLWGALVIVAIGTYYVTSAIIDVRELKTDMQQVKVQVNELHQRCGTAPGKMAALTDEPQF